jgi:hypothetical protein
VTDSIAGIHADIAEPAEMDIYADAGGEGTVIIESANALLQGLYPPYNETLVLANGSTVAWDRTQLISIETVEPDEETSLEGWISCDAWTTSLSAFYNSSEFVAQAKGANAFYQSISSVLGNRPLTYQNGYNIFDFMNVNYIHNDTLSPEIAPYLNESRYYANWRESRAFGNADPSNVANIAGQSILPLLIDGVQQISNTTNPLKFQYLAISYKPFISLFNMMGMPSPLNDTMVDYASMVIFEVRDDDTVTLRFRNSSEGNFGYYPMFGSSETSTPLDTFVDTLQPNSLDTLAKWCDKCQTSDARGCDVLAALNGTGGGSVQYASITSTTGRQHVSPVVAGVIGALVALAVAGVALAAWLFFGGLVKRTRRGRSSGAVGGKQGASGRRSQSIAGSIAGDSNVELHDSSHDAPDSDGTRSVGSGNAKN